MLKRAAIIIALVSLIAAAVNFPVAMLCAKSRLQPRAPMTLNLVGDDASIRRWPVPGPHQHPWPPLNHYIEERDFGYLHIQAHGGTAHQMQVEYTGWPLPCVRRVQMWWPWNDPVWATTAEPDPKPQIYWPGAIGNPLIFGVGLWTLLVLPAELLLIAQRRRRFRRRLCLKCGYPAAGKDPICTECGARVPSEYAGSAMSTGAVV